MVLAPNSAAHHARLLADDVVHVALQHSGGLGIVSRRGGPEETRRDRRGRRLWHIASFSSRCSAWTISGWREAVDSEEDGEEHIMNDPKTLSGDIALDLPEFDVPPAEPFSLLREWLARAHQLDVREPGAATLATNGEHGPSTRTVLLKDISDDHLVFTTSAESRKGRELDADPRCSMAFYWRETMQQIIVNGVVRKADSLESDSLFDARPAAARATVIASRQSEPLQDERVLRARAKEILASGDLVRPADWHAWHVEPQEIEFWHGRTDRFHRRLVFCRTGEGWAAYRLQP